MEEQGWAWEKQLHPPAETQEPRKGYCRGASALEVQAALAPPSSLPGLSFGKGADSPSFLQQPPVQCTPRDYDPNAHSSLQSQQDQGLHASFPLGCRDLGGSQSTHGAVTLASD